jgi:hypothetical protein
VTEESKRVAACLKRMACPVCDASLSVQSPRFGGHPKVPDWHIGCGGNPMHVFDKADLLDLRVRVVEEVPGLPGN